MATGCATGLTGSPATIDSDGATVAGKVVSDAGGPVEYWAEFGPTRAYGSETAHATVTAERHAVVSVTVAIEGLQRARTYNYRVCARDSQQQGGPGCGEDRRLTTQSVDCGETVTADVRLTGNLFCPQEPGLIVGADGIEIDLAGHRLDGSISVGGGGPRGIDNTGGFDDVTIRRGELPGWGTAIESRGASRLRVIRIDAAAANTALVVDGGADSEVRNADLFGRSWGLSSLDSDRLVVAGSEISGFFGGGLTATGDFVRVARNRIVTGAGFFPVTPGIKLNGTGGRVAGNFVQGGWPAGGITVTGPNNAIVDNEVLDAQVPPVTPVFEAFGDGIFVGAGSAGSVVRGNRAERNEGDGIDVESAGVRIGGNSAHGNGDLGIEAVPGVIDLGGNTASGNGNPQQCAGVFCP